MSDDCQERGFILTGFPENYEQARMFLLPRKHSNEKPDYDDDEEEGLEDTKELMDKRLTPGYASPLFII